MKLNRRQVCTSPIYVYSSILLNGIAPGLGCGVPQRASEPELLQSMAFGSCNKQNLVTTHWPIINSKRAQGWLWMGDAVYADNLATRSRVLEYSKVLQDKGYQDLLKQSFVLGTWDDHDYASNDAGAEYEDKVGSQEAFLNFIEEPIDSPRRNQQGIYWSKLVGAEGKQIQFILLDMRYFKQKDSLSNADPIGEPQWAWLESEIKRSGPQMKILVSSIQALTDFSGKDSWACYPLAQIRLLNLLKSSPVPITILSGDRHLHEVSKRDLSQDRSIFEITSSGLTHFADGGNLNKFALDSQIIETNFGLLSFDWDTKGKPTLKGLKTSIYSPQTGSLLRNLEIPLKW